jgi:phosphohistidine swiveling domain-containing protein
MQWIKMWSDRPYSPFLMVLATEATVTGFKKIYKASKITEGRNYWLNASNSYYYPEGELIKTVDNLSRKAIKSPSFLLTMLEIAYNKSINLRILSEKYKGKNLAEFSDDKLLNQIDNFSKKFFDFYSYGTIASLLGYQDENPIYKKFNGIIRAKTINQPEKFSDYLVILSNPPKILKSNLLDLEILKLAAQAKRKKIKNQKQILKNYRNDLSKVEKNYSFLSFDFSDRLNWNLNYFANLVFEKLSGNIKQNILKLKNYEKNTTREFNRLVRKLKLSKPEVKICELIRNLGYYKWAREYEFQEAFYNIKFIQDEIGKRIGLTTLEVKCLLASEYKQAIKKPAKYKKIAGQRIRNSLSIIKAKEGTKIIIGEEAKREILKMEIKMPETNLKVSELKGMPTYYGKARGSVKIIITIKDVLKMKKGDILVSQATSPDLLPAMKKAAAILTNEGGITSHAAIVSRELKIPCIVGTKIATKVLKDGDLVEVDADKGIVKILK